MQVSWTKDRRFSGRYPLKPENRRRGGNAASTGRPRTKRITVFGQRHPADYQGLTREDRRENLYFGLGMLIFFGAIAATAITLYVFIAVNAALLSGN